jgi:hypothetical protein
MRNSGELLIDFNASDACRFRFVDSQTIWLALDESHEDSRRVCLLEPLTLEPLSLQELNCYHRQLFGWLLKHARQALPIDSGSEPD